MWMTGKKDIAVSLEGHGREHYPGRGSCRQDSRAGSQAHIRWCCQLKENRRDHQGSERGTEKSSKPWNRIWMLRWYQDPGKKKNRISCSITSEDLKRESWKEDSGSARPERGRGIREEPVQHGGEHQRTGRERPPFI